MKYNITKVTSTSNSNIKFIFNNYIKLVKPTIKNTYFIKLLYTLIDKASNKNTPHSIIKNLSVNVEPIHNTKYISPEINNYILINKFIHYNIQLKIKDATYNIHIYSIKDININKYIYFIKLILNLCAEEANTGHNVFTFKIILTDFKKTQPSMPISPFTINSGLTSYPLPVKKDDHKEIIVFRKEEWFKVFIHECFHLFCLDFSNIEDISYVKLFKPLYNINSEFLFFESLCEFWARTINIAIISYSSKKNLLYDDFEELMQINLKLESIYSLLQLKYSLNNLGFTYESLMDQSRTLEFTENTNYFCYYVLTSVLLFHYDQTMAWFIDNNQTILQFNKNKNNIILFFYYIKSIHNNPALLKIINNLKEFNLKNNYMSLFEILI
jgi:hypothetical protein